MAISAAELIERCREEGTCQTLAEALAADPVARERFEEGQAFWRAIDANRKVIDLAFKPSPVMRTIDRGLFGREPEGASLPEDFRRYLVRGRN